MIAGHPDNLFVAKNGVNPSLPPCLLIEYRTDELALTFHSGRRVEPGEPFSQSGSIGVDKTKEFFGVREAKGAQSEGGVDLFFDSSFAPCLITPLCS